MKIRALLGSAGMIGLFQSCLEAYYHMEWLDLRCNIRSVVGDRRQLLDTERIKFSF